MLKLASDIACQIKRMEVKYSTSMNFHYVFTCFPTGLKNLSTLGLTNVSHLEVVSCYYITVTSGLWVTYV